MSRDGFRVVLIFVLAFLFVAGQFHLCADTNTGADNSHFCPFCATTGLAIFAPALNMTVIPVLGRLETAAVAFGLSVDIPRVTSPRAPPSFV